MDPWKYLLKQANRCSAWSIKVLEKFLFGLASAGVQERFGGVPPPEL